MPDTFDALALLDIAADQWGLMTTAQSRKVGGTPQRIARLAAAGTLERLRHGVYRIAGSPPHPHDQLRGAWLMLDPERTATERLRDEHPGVVSHRSAADVHRLGNLDADVFEFVVADRRQSRLKDLRFHRASLSRDQWVLVDGLPVATLLTTVEQLAASNVDGGHLAGVVRDALTVRHVDLAELASVLRPHAHRYGAMLGDGYGLVQLLLEDVGVPQSTLDVARLSAAPGPRLTEIAAMAGLISANPELRRLTDEIARIGPSLLQSADLSIGGGPRSLSEFASAIAATESNPALEAFGAAVAAAANSDPGSLRWMASVQQDPVVSAERHAGFRAPRLPDGESHTIGADADPDGVGR